MRARPGGNGPDGYAVRAGNLVRSPGDREPEGRTIPRMSGIDTLHFDATAVEPHVAVAGIGTWVIGRVDGPSERARADCRDNRVEARDPEMAQDAIDVIEPGGVRAGLSIVGRRRGERARLVRDDRQVVRRVRLADP